MLHSNIYDSISPISSDGNIYFLTFIDDYNGKPWFYLLEKVFSKFKEFKNLVETWNDYKLKCLRTKEVTTYQINLEVIIKKIILYLNALCLIYLNIMGFLKEKNRIIFYMVWNMLKKNDS